MDPHEPRPDSEATESAVGRLGSGDPTLPARDPEATLPAGAGGAGQHERGQAPPPPGSAALDRLADSLIDALEKHPKRIAAFEIVRVLGKGGMGVVYEARQDRPQRNVALKVVRPGLASKEALRRFELEAQVLARLQHPGIAQVYEVGTADIGAGPQPYFAMELVLGPNLRDYAESRKLSVKQRLDLMSRVCDAVQHAHQKGIIHRDLKPGNILVDEAGQPKILDFGVARVTDSDIRVTTIQTDVGQLIGTIPYMSPEQVSADPNELDTRSDVYALGVILYELLAGRLPYDVHKRLIHEAVRVIREEDPTPLSSINRTLRGDVETIVAKAMEKNKTRRYQAASALAADIRRYLGNEPIAARPASAMYQISKFARRNRALVGGLVAVFVVLVAGVITSTTLYFRAEKQFQRAELARRLESEQRAIAEANREKAIQEAARADAQARKALQERDKSERITDFMGQTLAGVGPSVARGRDTKMLHEMMDAGSKRIHDGELTPAPEAELRLRLTIGETYRRIAEYEAADEMLRPAIELARSLGRDDDGRLARAMDCYASLLKDRGRLPDALAQFKAALSIWRRIHMHDHADVALALNNVGSCFESQGRFSEALENAEAALVMYQRLHEGDHPNVARSMGNSARCLQRLGRSKEALSRFQAAFEMLRRLYGGDHPDTAVGISNLVSCLVELGRPAEALPKCKDSLAMRERLYGGDHVAVATGLSDLGLCLMSLRRPAQALPRLEAALAMRQRLHKGDHPDVAKDLANLGYCLGSLDRWDEAMARGDAALAMQLRLFGGDNPEVAMSMSNVAFRLQSVGRLEEALGKHEAALQMRQRLFSGDHPHVAMSLNNLGGCLLDLGRRDDALQKFETGLEMRRRLYGDHHPMVAQSLSNVADCLALIGRYGAAALKYEDAVQSYQGGQKQDQACVATCLNNIGHCLYMEGRYSEALPKYEAALAMDQRLRPHDPINTLYSQVGLGSVLAELNRFDEAESMLLEAQDAIRSIRYAPMSLRRRGLERLVRLFELRHGAEQGKGYDQKAEEWREKLKAWQVTTQPATSRPMATQPKGTQ